MKRRSNKEKASVGKIIPILKTIGEIGTGLGFIAAVFIWVFSYWIWALRCSLFLFPILVFLVSRFFNLSKKVSFVFTFQALIPSLAIGYWSATHLRNVQSDHAPDFSIQTTWMQNETGDMKYIDDNNGQIIPFDGAVLVQFTNLKPVPLMINSYAIEKETPDGKWVRSDLLPKYGINRGGVLMGYDSYTNLTEWIYTSFDSAIQNKNIAPNETVRGWLFFKHYFGGVKIRFRVKDALGHIFVEPLQGGFGVENGWPVQDLLMNKTTNVIDVRSLTISKEP